VIEKIGFMQGRLSPLVDRKIQCFPWDHWRYEFALAQRCHLRLMEGTLYQERLYENPLMTTEGQAEIKRLCQMHDLTIPSLTGDCFMQAPFWKFEGTLQTELKRDFIAIAHACNAVGISIIVVPLVDNGALENDDEKRLLIDFLVENSPLFSSLGLKVVFECDFEPEALKGFIDELDADLFGINYDIGNSAALGFDAREEFASYAARIVNVHVKDRLLHGTTVPLGTGNANFELVFALLDEHCYSGNLILQTARASDNDHFGVLLKYRDMVSSWAASGNRRRLAVSGIRPTSGVKPL
jgi:hexulose-6-phosphate isomerase